MKSTGIQTVVKKTGKLGESNYIHCNGKKNAFREKNKGRETGFFNPLLNLLPKRLLAGAPC